MDGVDSGGKVGKKKFGKGGGVKAFRGVRPGHIRDVVVFKASVGPCRTQLETSLQDRLLEQLRRRRSSVHLLLRQVQQDLAQMEGTWESLELGSEPYPFAMTMEWFEHAVESAREFVHLPPDILSGDLRSQLASDLINDVRAALPKVLHSAVMRKTDLILGGQPNSVLESEALLALDNSPDAQEPLRQALSVFAGLPTGMRGPLSVRLGYMARHTDLSQPALARQLLRGIRTLCPLRSAFPRSLLAIGPEPAAYRAKFYSVWISPEEIELLNLRFQSTRVASMTIARWKYNGDNDFLAFASWNGRKAGPATAHVPGDPAEEVEEGYAEDEWSHEATMTEATTPVLTESELSLLAADPFLPPNVAGLPGKGSLSPSVSSAGALASGGVPSPSLYKDSPSRKAGLEAVPPKRMGGASNAGRIRGGRAASRAAARAAASPHPSVPSREGGLAAVPPLSVASSHGAPKPLPASAKPPQPLKTSTSSHASYSNSSALARAVSSSPSGPSAAPMPAGLITDTPLDDIAEEELLAVQGIIMDIFRKAAARRRAEKSSASESPSSDAAPLPQSGNFAAVSDPGPAQRRPFPSDPSPPIPSYSAGPPRRYPGGKLKPPYRSSKPFGSTRGS